TSTKSPKRYSPCRRGPPTMDVGGGASWMLAAWSGKAAGAWKASGALIMTRGNCKHRAGRTRARFFAHARSKGESPRGFVARLARPPHISWEASEGGSRPRAVSLWRFDAVATDRGLRGLP